MSKIPDRSDSAFNAKAWIVPGVVTCVLAAAAVSYTRSAEIQAAAGSPYYSKAVQEALGGLQNPGEKQALAAAELPAGLSPDEHYWCEQCKAYHKRQPAGAAAGGGEAVPGANGSAAVVSPAGTIPAPVAAEGVPPLPQGLSPEDYYWCVNCKTYHPRSDSQGSVPGGAGVDSVVPPLLRAPPSASE